MNPMLQHHIHSSIESYKNIIRQNVKNTDSDESNAIHTKQRDRRKTYEK